MRSGLQTLARHRFALAIALPLVIAADVLTRVSVAEERAAGEQDALFGQTKVWSLHLAISADEFDAMQPAVAAFGAPAAPTPAAGNSDNGRQSERNLFGTEFPWAEADVTVDGETLKKAGVRYSGDIT